MIKEELAKIFSSFRKEIVLSAKMAYKKMLENDEKGIKPLYRTRKEMLSDRGSKKDPSHQWWKKNDSKENYTAVMYVPPTPHGTLMKMSSAREKILNAKEM